MELWNGRLAQSEQAASTVQTQNYTLFKSTTLNVAIVVVIVVVVIGNIRDFAF